MRVLRFIKRAAKTYLKVAAENYSIRCTGDIFIPAP